MCDNGPLRVKLFFMVGKELKPLQWLTELKVLTLYTQLAPMSPENTHTLMGFHIEVLILGVTL